MTKIRYSLLFLLLSLVAEAQSNHTLIAHARLTGPALDSGQGINADTSVQETPVMLVQRQLNAYNARNIDAFLDTYSDDVELYQFPATLLSKGKEAMRAQYGTMFKEVTNLHCEIVGRITLGETIIDHERVRFGERIVEAIAIYEVKNGRIVKVTFKQ